MQASRRLARKAHKELQSRNFGYVQVAAQAYVYMLQHLPPEDSNLFARELIAQHVVSCSGTPQVYAQQCIIGAQVTATHDRGVQRLSGAKHSVVMTEP